MKFISNFMVNFESQYNWVRKCLSFPVTPKIERTLETNITPVPVFAVYIPRAIAVRVAVAATILSLSPRKSCSPDPSVSPASLIPAVTC